MNIIMIGDKSVISILLNLKLCHKFLSEEDFGTLSDAHFERLEENLERIARMIEFHRSLLASGEPRPRKDSLIAALDRYSGWVEQFWSQQWGPKVGEQLEAELVDLGQAP